MLEFFNNLEANNYKHKVLGQEFDSTVSDDNDNRGGEHEHKNSGPSIEVMSDG